MARVNIEENGSTKRELRIEIPAEEVDERLQAELGRIQKDLALPGFRRGRVPTDVVRKRFSGSARRDVAEKLVRDSCLEAIREHGLRPIAPPEVHDLSFEEGQALTFRATVEVWPRVELGRWRGLPGRRDVHPVEESEVTRQLELLRELHAELVPVDRPGGAGDFLLVDYDVFDEQEKPLEGRGVRNHQVELGSETLLRDFGEGLMGVRAGESRTVRVSFPSEGVHRDVAGRTLTFWVKVAAVKEKVRPELTDDFAKDLGRFDRLEDVKAEIRAGLEREAEMEADRRLSEMLIDRLIEENPFEAPASMVDGLLQSIVDDLEKQHRGEPPFDRQKAEAAFRPSAIRHSKRFVVLREVGKRESLSVTPQEIDARVRFLAGQTRQSPEEVRRRIDDDGSMDRLVGDLLEEKVLALLRDSASVEPAGPGPEGPGSPHASPA